MRLSRIVCLAALLWAGSVRHIDATCSVSTTGVVFGGYNVFNTSPVDTTGAMTCYCDKNEKTIRITLDHGNSATFSRYLVSGANHLSYNLYLDATRTTIWGDGSNGSGSLDIAKASHDQSVDFTVYARIPAGQDAAVGGYTDTLVFTVLY